MITVHLHRSSPVSCSSLRKWLRASWMLWQAKIRLRWIVHHKKAVHFASPGGYPCHYGLGEQCTNTWDRQPMARPHAPCCLSVVCFMLVSPISLVHSSFIPIRFWCWLFVCCHCVVVAVVVSAADGGGSRHGTLLMSRHGSKVLDWWPQVPQVSRERSCPCNGD